MSDEYQQRPQGQDKQQPGEQEEMERRREEREAVEKRLRGRARAAAASEYGSVSSEATDYGSRISEVASEAKDYVSDKVSVVGDKFKDLRNVDLGELAENAKQYARQNPSQAMLISAAAGLLLGLLIRGRR